MRKTFYKVLNFPSNNVLAIKKEPFIQLEQDLKLDEIIKNIKNQQLNVEKREKSDSQREFLCFRFVGGTFMLFKPHQMQFKDIISNEYHHH